MKTCVDARFLDEARLADLRFRCDDCAYFDGAQVRCTHGYPIAPHRPPTMNVGDTVVFCKEFELGVHQDAAP
jgi:hypothetical protein